MGNCTKQLPEIFYIFKALGKDELTIPCSIKDKDEFQKKSKSGLRPERQKRTFLQECWDGQTN